MLSQCVYYYQFMINLCMSMYELCMGYNILTATEQSTVPLHRSLQRTNQQDPTLYLRLYEYI